jgi:steroid delta-isomerase-like uncharacterized protein
VQEYHKEEVEMKKRLHAIAACVLSGVVLVSGCSSKDVQRKSELLSLYKEESNALNSHDFEKYAAGLTDEFKWDLVSAPAPLSRTDFIAFISSMFKGDASSYHWQDKVLTSGDVLFFDGCSSTFTNQKTGIFYRTFHADFEYFDGKKMKSMTTFGDGAVSDVALGNMEPPLPAPPLPGTRPWLTTDPQPTKLKPLDAQKESQARWNSHDLNSLAKMVGKDAQILVHPLYDPVGRDAFVGWLGIMIKAFPDLTVNSVRTFDMGDGWVVSEVQMTGTNTGAYLGHPATGKPFTLRAAYAGRYDANGLMTVLRLYFDSMTIMNQLGLKPVMVTATKT